jgi:type VI secretion system protein ImpA
MNDAPSAQQVIDLDLILKPISEENPSGESLRYSGLYDEIGEARRSDDDLNQGDWQTELKVADHRKVIELAVSALETRSKDLQIASWLSEALVKVHNFAGLRDGIKLLAGLQENFWDSLHPEIDEGDMEGRGNAIAWFDIQAAAAVKASPITGGNGYSYNGWADAKTFDFPPDLDSLDADSQEKFRQLRAQAEAEHRVTAEMWKAAVGKTSRAFVETVNATIEECWAAFAELNRVIEERYDRNQMPGLGTLKKALDDVHTQVKKLLEKKRAEEPDQPDEVDETAVDDVSGEGVATKRSGHGNAGPVNDRPDALRRLTEIAAFFHRTEPHSPVSYLVQRAVKWGNMPLDNWLQDVIKDESVLGQLRETLGLGNTSAASDTLENTYEDSGSSAASETSSNDW